MASPLIIATNCTSRKRTTATALTVSKSDLRRPIDELARRWTKSLGQAKPIAEAGRMYGGRSIVEAKKAARVADADLYIVSAGLGLVHELDPVPSYDLTIAAGSGSIASYLKNHHKSSTDWWDTLTSELGRPRPTHSLFTTRKNAVVIFALPASYLRLILSDLSTLSSKQTARTRIITSRFGWSVVPDRLKACVMPYDERLEGDPAYAGTRAEFPQRALSHFVNKLEGHLVDSENGRTLVLRSMTRLTKPSLPSRTRGTDDEIRNLLRHNWDKYGGKSGRLLRYLRDDALIACEQRRFRVIWRELQNECQR